MRTDAVAPPERSAAARAKEGVHRTPDGLPVSSFRGLLADLGTLTRNGWSWPGATSGRPSRSSPRPRRSRHAPWPSREPCPGSQNETARSDTSVLDHGLRGLEVRSSRGWRPAGRESSPPAPPEWSQPRPMNGISVAMRVIDWTFASSGSPAIMTTARTTLSTSMVGSGRIEPSA